MIVPYVGEFLINPIPLEMSLNYCSHKCLYCFANLNKPNRTYNPHKLLRFLQKYKNQSNLTAILLKAGYPVLISNRVDPFATSNYRHTLPILEIMSGLNISVSIQTRGGLGVDDALGIIKPSVWYISITTTNNKLQRQIEPGSPRIEEKLKLIEKLIRLGHSVVVGINPAVPEWLPNPMPLLIELKKVGVWGVWVERLHLNYKQIKNMSPSEQVALGPELLKRARKRIISPQDFEQFKLVRYLAKLCGLEIYSVGQPNYSRFFEPWRVHYKKTFPVFQDFINTLTNHTPNNLISFNEFETFTASQLPVGKLALAHYLGATSRDVFKRRKIPHKMTFTDLLKIIWQDPKTKYSLVKSPGFAYATLGHPPKHILLQGVHKMPLMCYNKDGFKNYFNEVVI